MSVIQPENINMHWGSKCQDSIGIDLDTPDDGDPVILEPEDVMLSEKESIDLQGEPQCPEC